MKGLTKTRLKRFWHASYDVPLVAENDCTFSFVLQPGDDDPSLIVPMKISLILMKDAKFLQIHGEVLNGLIPRSQSGEALLLCNDWNSAGDEPFGRAAFMRESKTIVIDGLLPTNHEINDDELDDFFHRTFIAIISFLNKAAEVFGW